MKKSKVLLSFISIILCGAFMIGVFNTYSTDFFNTAEAEIKGKVYKFTEAITEKINTPQVNKINENITERVYLGGYLVGLKLYANGVMVVDTESVDTENGMVNPAQKAGIKVGDIIKKVNGKAVKSNSEVSSAIEKSQGKKISFEISRSSKIFTVSFNSEFSVSEGKFKAGMWIRDSAAGIGTVTFCTKEGYFASLGHAVCDIDTNKVLPIFQGDTTEVTIYDLRKGAKGYAGELCGYLEADKTGKVFYNGSLGVYGCFNELPEAKIMEIAPSNEVKKGSATIFTTLENGVTKEYSIKIKDVNMNSAENKNLVIEVTDKELIEKTGGIVQGMSGSPIVQNGKIVGAVTHVFLNDSSGGYGIFAETMLRNVKSIEQTQTLKNAS